MICSDAVDQLLNVVLLLLELLALLLVINHVLLDDLDHKSEICFAAGDHCGAFFFCLLELEDDVDRSPLFRRDVCGLAKDGLLDLGDDLLVVGTLASDEGTKVVRLHIDGLGVSDSRFGLLATGCLGARCLGRSCRTHLTIYSVLVVLCCILNSGLDSLI